MSSLASDIVLKTAKERRTTEEQAKDPRKRVVVLRKRYSLRRHSEQEEELRKPYSLWNLLYENLLPILGWDSLTRAQRVTAMLWSIRIASGLCVLALLLILVDRISNIPALALAQLLFTASIPVVITLVGNRYTQRRAQDEALQAYLDQMSRLLLEEDLRTSEESREVRTLARARTLTVLATLGPGYRGWVITFLSEAALVQRVDKSNPIIELRNVNLAGMSLERTDLNGADLRGAILTETYLEQIDLSEANLSEANLREANLRNSNLSDSNLSKAWLYKAELGKANLSGAILINAYLAQTDLRFARLTGADLSGAYLRSAQLTGADLSEALLTNASIPEDQVAQCGSLEGATMPNGQKYEDWLKSKGREKEGEHGGSS